LLRSIEPHDEGGQPIVSMHYDLLKRVIREIPAAPRSFEEALTDRIAAEGFRLTEGPYAIGAANFHKGAHWAWNLAQEMLENGKGFSDDD
jgi:hypothetical protein